MSELTIAEHVLKYRDVIDPSSKATASQLLRRSRKELVEDLDAIDRGLEKEKRPEVIQTLKECQTLLRDQLQKVDEALSVCAQD